MINNVVSELPFHLYAIVSSGGHDISDDLKIISIATSLEIRCLAIRKFDIVFVREVVDLTSLERKKVLQYFDVVSKIHDKYPLLPFRYGTLYESMQDVEEMIRLHEGLVESEIDRLSNTDEYEVKVINLEKRGNDNDLEDIGEKEKKFERLHEEEMSPAMQYMAKKFRQYKKEHMSEKMLEDIKSVIIEELSGLLCDYMFVKKKLADRIVVDLIFLADKNKKNIVIDKVKNLESMFGTSVIVLTGPWPPYSFVKLNL